MTMTHPAIAQIFTDRLAPAAFVAEESSVERGRRAEMEAFSLARLVGQLLPWRRRLAADPQAELRAAVERLSDLSPHLLIDVGIDPATGAVAEDGVVLRLERPGRGFEELPGPVQVPVEARRPARPRLQVRVLPAAEPGALPAV